MLALCLGGARKISLAARAPILSVKFPHSLTTRRDVAACAAAFASLVAELALGQDIAADEAALLVFAGDAAGTAVVTSDFGVSMGHDFLSWAPDTSVTSAVNETCVPDVAGTDCTMLTPGNGEPQGSSSFVPGTCSQGCSYRRNVEQGTGGPCGNDIARMAVYQATYGSSCLVDNSASTDCATRGWDSRTAGWAGVLCCNSYKDSGVAGRLFCKSLNQYYGASGNAGRVTALIRPETLSLSPNSPWVAPERNMVALSGLTALAYLHMGMDSSFPSGLSGDIGSLVPLPLVFLDIQYTLVFGDTTAISLLWDCTTNAPRAPANPDHELQGAWYDDPCVVRFTGCDAMQCSSGTMVADPATWAGRTEETCCDIDRDVDCNEITLPASACTACGQELYTVNAAPAGNGATCNGSSNLCGDGDGVPRWVDGIWIETLLSCGNCTGNTGGGGDYTCVEGTLKADAETIAGADDVACCDPPPTVDCVEATAATSTCTTCGQELYTLTTPSSGAGLACTGSSTLCGDGDGETPIVCTSPPAATSGVFDGGSVVLATMAGCLAAPMAF